MGLSCADPSRAVRKAVIYANPSRAAGKTGVFAEIVIAPEPAQERFRQTAGKERRESCMMLSCRDLDILRLLRWCRMIRSKELCEAFSKDEVMNLSAAQMIRFSDAAKAWLLTPCGNRVLGSAGFVLPPATAPTYREPDIIRRLRLAQIVTTAYAAGVNVFLMKESALQSSPSLFLPFLHRNRGSNPWGSTRVAALLHTGDLMCTVHWVSPGIGCVALTDELTAFQNHTAAISAKQRAMIFAASNYEEILAELDAAQENQNTRLQSYREVYDCLKLPLFLLPCNDTGCLQLRIMGVPNYRELLARIILKSHYVSPPANRAMYDAMYQGAPFVMAADMNLRRIDAAVETACSDGLSRIVLAAFPEQVEAVLNRRYRETGKARVFTITESALLELLGSIAPYAPPDLPFYTSEGSVLDVPPLKAP
jgi:hypothetical protein